MKEVISYVFSNCRKTKRVQSDCGSDRGIKKKKKGIWKERDALSVGVLAILQNIFHRILMMKGLPDGCMRIFRSSQRNGNWQYPKIRKNSSIF